MKLRRVTLAVLLACSPIIVAAVPILPMVPLLLEQVLAYLHPNDHTTVYPDTPRVTALLRKKQSFICHTKIMVTTPSTVAFYREKSQFGNYLGVTKVGKWLTNNLMCIDNQRIVAVTWNNKGKAFTFKTSKSFSNINQQLSLVYPRDFNAPVTKNTVLCQVSVLNNSALPMAFYAEKIASDTRLAILKPYQRQQLTAPCFQAKRILGVYAKQNQEKLILHYFATTAATNDINHLSVIEFPKQFKSAGKKQVTLKPDLLKLLLALL